MAFFVELWESVFTPGTTPALIKATHASFILLILSLISLIFLSGSIHFVNLLVISVLLYASVIWFVHELNQAKLKSNEEIEQEAGEEEAAKEAETGSSTAEVKAPVKDQAPAKEPTTSKTSATKPAASPRKRKV